MKRFILAATLLAALSTSAFADGKKSTVKLLGDLKASLKTVNAAAWTHTSTYSKTTFALNGKEVTAYMANENLVGFFMPVEMSALPQGTTESLEKKYKGWKPINPVMFIDAKGNIAYYVQVNKGKDALALSVSPKGRLSINSRLPY